MIPGIFAGAMSQGGGGGFTYQPRAIYDPSNLSTMFKDVAGTVPVTTDGDPIERWNDATGGGRDYIQPTSGSRLIYRTAGGFHWVEVTLGQFMYGVSAGMLSFAQAALFIGYRPVSGTNDYGSIFGVPHANSHSSPFWRWNLCTRTSGGNTFGFTANGAQFLDQASPAAAVGNDVLMAIGFSGMWRADMSAMWYPLVRVNKTLHSAGSAGTANITYPNSTPPYLGAHLGTVDGRFQGRIYGALVADTNPNSQAWIDEWEAWIDARLP